MIVKTELLNSINALEPATGGGEETPGPSQSGNGDDEPAITHENKNQTLKYIILIIIGLVFIAEIVIVTVFLTKKKKSGK